MIYYPLAQKLCVHFARVMKMLVTLNYENKTDVKQLTFLEIFVY